MSGDPLADLAIERLPCPTCKAAVGKPCVTASGAVASRLHMWRRLAIDEAWAVGYNAGFRDAKHRWLSAEP